MRLMHLAIVAIALPGLAGPAAAFDLNARKCFGGMYNPEKVWNDYMPRCFNDKHATSCGQATSNTRDQECLHDLNLQLARIAIQSGRHGDGLSAARYAIRNVDTAEAWITYGIAFNGQQQPLDQRVAGFDEIIGKLSSRSLDGQQSRAFDALKQQREKAQASLSDARGRQQARNDQAQADYDALKARCAGETQFDGKPTFMFGSGATNYLREVQAIARNASTGVTPALHDKRRNDGLGAIAAGAAAMMQPFVCIKAIKYLRHVTTQSGPGGGKAHIAEVLISGVGRDLKDTEQRVEVAYPD